MGSQAPRRFYEKGATSPADAPWLAEVFLRPWGPDGTPPWLAEVKCSALWACWRFPLAGRGEIQGQLGREAQAHTFPGW